MKTLKIFTILLSLFVLSTTVSFGQKADKEKIVMVNMLNSLDFGVDGVVEAAIYNSIFLHQYYPEINIQKVINKLNDVAEDASNPAIQFKAQLASLYLSNYENNLNFEDYKADREKVFQKIAQELETSLLVSSK